MRAGVKADELVVGRTAHPVVDAAILSAEVDGAGEQDDAGGKAAVHADLVFVGRPQSPSKVATHASPLRTTSASSCLHSSLGCVVALAGLKLLQALTIYLRSREVRRRLTTATLAVGLPDRRSHHYQRNQPSDSCSLHLSPSSY